MIILRPHQNKFLMPVPKAEWRAPTIVEKDQFGNPGVQTRFRITAKFRQIVVWRGWLDDRDDADAFLFAIAMGNLHQQPALWHLPVPAWAPGMADELSYEFATVTFLTSPTGSNQTYSTPTDWNSGNNSVECLGASGAGGGHNGGSGGGSGGGAYSKVTNLSITGSVTYQIGTGAVATTAAGTAGGDTWFNSTTLAGSSVGAKGGGGGGLGIAGAGGAGGDSASGTGTTKYSGGNGSAGVYASYSGAGGGAAGPSGAGGAASTTTGGSANNGTTAGSAANTDGVAGTEWDATHGCGSGSGGLTGAFTANTGGLYAGGSTGRATTTGGNGKQGMVVVTYEPVKIFGGNMPMLGM